MGTSLALEHPPIFLIYRGAPGKAVLGAAAELHHHPLPLQVPPVFVPDRVLRMMMIMIMTIIMIGLIREGHTTPRDRHHLFLSRTQAGWWLVGSRGKG